MRRFITLAVAAVSLAPFNLSCAGNAPLRTGADMLLASHLGLLGGKRVGLVTNQTGRVSGGGLLVDSLLAHGISLTVLFSPEHGIRGRTAAGESVRDTVDASTGLPILSLHGAVRKPAPAMLQGLDVLLYDLQDVGARFYTYISTMMLCMEAAAERGIPFIVLDRPNPLGGLLVDGPVLEDSLRSFLGMVPVPVIYGLTCGELALMINGEGWLGKGIRADLTVIPMEGWNRSMRWEETGIEWIPPSPNIPTPATALVYPATCFLEATNLSEGRGTPAPFQTIGAPFIDGEKLAAALHEAELPGLRVDTASFIPASSKYAELVCRGVRLTVIDPSKFRPVTVGLALLHHLRRLFPDSVRIRERSLERLLGSGPVSKKLQEGAPPEALSALWEAELGRFRGIAKPYLLYND